MTTIDFDLIKNTPNLCIIGDFTNWEISYKTQYTLDDGKYQYKYAIFGKTFGNLSNNFDLVVKNGICIVIDSIGCDIHNDRIFFNDGVRITYNREIKDCAKYLLAIAQYYESVGDKYNMKQYYLKTLTKATNDNESLNSAIVSLADYYKNKGKIDKMKTHLNTYIKSNNIEAYKYLANYYETTNKLEKALPLWKHLIESDRLYSEKIAKYYYDRANFTSLIKHVECNGPMSYMIWWYKHVDINESIANHLEQCIKIE